MSKRLGSLVGGAVVAALSLSVLSSVQAHEPGTFESPIVEQRVAKFKQSGGDIQSVFKKHLPAGDLDAVAAAALRMAAWADEMPEYFPKGSVSVGADKSLWDDFFDFKAKAKANASAARALHTAALSGDKSQVVTAAKRVGGTCKSCHDSYRIKH
jgi:cytochrome c556